jgi:formyltetrahydrofolate-dependent phosphoribosylglycinamide formyltransferase
MRLVVLISGNGSNLQAIIDAIARGTLAAQIVLVVSNHKDAYGLERARQAGIETYYHPLKPYKIKGLTRNEYEADLSYKISRYKPDLIVLAGWMHILGAEFLEDFPNKVINLHPALPGEFPGKNAIERAFEAWQRGEIRRSGVMVHYVIPEVDAGKAIEQAEVPFQAHDTLETFTQRLHEVEHRALVNAIRTFQKQRSS